MTIEEQVELYKLEPSDANFRPIYDHIRTVVKIVAIKRRANKSDLEDITQDVMVNIIKNLDKYNPTRARFTTWVNVIAHNKFNYHYNERGKVPTEFRPFTQRTDLTTETGKDVIDQLSIASYNDDETQAYTYEDIIEALKTFKYPRMNRKTWQEYDNIGDILLDFFNGNITRDVANKYNISESVAFSIKRDAGRAFLKHLRRVIPDKIIL